MLSLSCLKAILDSGSKLFYPREAMGETPGSRDTAAGYRLLPLHCLEMALAKEIPSMSPRAGAPFVFL